MSTTSLKHKEITRFVAVGSRSRGRGRARVCDNSRGGGGVPAPRVCGEEKRKKNYKLFS